MKQSDHQVDESMKKVVECIDIDVNDEELEYKLALRR
jgi:hypothetical protein